MPRVRCCLFKVGVIRAIPKPNLVHKSQILATFDGYVVSFVFLNDNCSSNLFFRTFHLSYTLYKCVFRSFDLCFKVNAFINKSLLRLPFVIISFQTRALAFQRIISKVLLLYYSEWVLLEKFCLWLLCSFLYPLIKWHTKKKVLYELMHFTYKYGIQ